MVFTNVNPIMEDNKVLGDISLFWSWSKKDGKMPKKLQFRYAGVRDVEGGENIYWVNTWSPVFDVSQKIKAIPQTEASTTCYKTELASSADGNFVIAKDQTPITVNWEYLTDLYPDLGTLLCSHISELRFNCRWHLEKMQF